MKSFFCAIVTAVLFCTSAMASVADVSQEWAGYWNAKNIDGALNLYAPQPTFLPTVGKAWNGTAAIRANFTALLKTYDPHITLTSQKTDSSGTLAYDTGSYDEVIDRVKGGAPIYAHGHYLFLFQKQKRGWKILEQTFTENAPVKF